jgi:hypothetical protein
MNNPNKLLTADVVIVERSFGLLACIPREGGEWISAYGLAEALRDLGYDRPGRVGRVTFEVRDAGVRPKGQYTNPYVSADRGVIPVVERRELNPDLERFDISTIGTETTASAPKRKKAAARKAADDIPM